MSSPDHRGDAHPDGLTSFQIEAARLFGFGARFGKPLLLTRAAEIDLGFNQQIFAEMLRTQERYEDADIPVPASDTATVRAFFRNWAAELAHD